MVAFDDRNATREQLLQPRVHPGLVPRARHREPHHRDDDGNPCVFGDVIEAALPFHYLVARALGGDGQDEFFRLVAHLHHLLHQSGGFFSIHGNPAAVAEEPAHRKAEQFCLAHKVDVCAQAEDHAQEKEKVPVGGVRRADQHEFREVG